MKKIAFVIAMVFSLFLVMSCKTTETQEPVNETPQAEVSAFQQVYNEYRADLILDGATKYTVKSGDTLSRVARSQYKNGFYFPIILLANLDLVEDMDVIEPGMELTIPDLNRNLNDATAKGKIKEFLGKVAELENTRNRPRDADGLKMLADSL